MKPTVLVVDDDTKFLTFLGQTLKRGGFTVLTSSDGSDVSDVLSSTPVDVLLLDLQMPGMNGWEVLRRVRDERQMAAPNRGDTRQRPKIVVVSGRNEDATVAFVRHLGADAYLTKPLWGDQLLATVRGLLES